MVAKHGQPACIAVVERLRCDVVTNSTRDAPPRLEQLRFECWNARVEGSDLVSRYALVSRHNCGACRGQGFAEIGMIRLRRRRRGQFRQQRGGDEGTGSRTRLEISL